MSASDNFITRPVLTTICSLLIVIGGLISIPLLPIENLPDIAPPTVNVMPRTTAPMPCRWSRASPPCWSSRSTGWRMEFITSTSAADGSSSITVSFASGTNGDINQVNVQNKVALAEPQLPEEVRQSGVVVNKASNSILLVYNFGSEDAANAYSTEFISGLLDQNLTDQIKRVPGVGNLVYFGNRKLAFRLWLDPDRLAANRLTSADVVAALRSQNRLVPAGQVGSEPAIDGQQFTFTVQLQGRLRSAEEFGEMILRSSGEGGPLRLKDVGRVTLGGESYFASATDLQGVPSVGMAIYQLSGSNALEVSRGVQEVLDTFSQTMPPGMNTRKFTTTLISSMHRSKESPTRCEMRWFLLS